MTERFHVSFKNKKENEEMFNERLATLINRFWITKGFDPEAKVIKLNGFQTEADKNIPPVYVISSNLIGTNGFPAKKWYSYKNCTKLAPTGAPQPDK